MSDGARADLLRELLAAIDERTPVVVATVVATRRSVPRRAGSKMLVYGDGSISGTIGGGEMEARVVAESLAALAERQPRRLTYSLLDPASGDPGVCGGEVELYLEPHMPQSTVFVVGVGHVGRAVVELAGWLGHRVVAWDDRAELVAQADLTGDEESEFLTGPIADAVATAGIDAETSIVMVTRNVVLDVEIIPALLATPARYIGLMGSQRRWDTTRRKLGELGIGDDDLTRIAAPIGIEIAAETPSEIAVSIMAEVIGRHRGG